MHRSLLVAALVASASALVERNDVGKLPAMGWNSWNAYHCDINEAKIMSAAHSLVDLGLKAVGYQYVNLDDCWSVKSGRDRKTKRIIVDTSRFPNGLTQRNSKGTAKQIHDLGLKIGIYSSAGTETCAGYPASLDYETVDAQTWAEWGIDYLKYDNCNVPSNRNDECKGCVPDNNYGGPYPNGTCKGLAGNWCPTGYDYTKSKTFQRDNAMGDALKAAATKSPILYSLCNWGFANVWTWGNSSAASWRTTDDITPSWPRILEILNQNSFYLNYVDFWGHGDADMLEVGNGDLTFEENRSHFALWAAMKSPLLIGTDLSRLNQANLAILKNKFLVGFNQDTKYGKPAKPYKWGTNPDWTFSKERPAEYWSGQSSQGVLVLALNTDGASKVKTIRWSDVPELKGKGDRFAVTDVWDGSDQGCLAYGFDIQLSRHDTGAYMIAPCASTTKKRSVTGRLHVLTPN